MHTLSLEDAAPGQHAHYAALFGACAEDTEQAALYAALPPPVPLQSALGSLEAYLAEFPTALVGEIGLDRRFTVLDPRAGHKRRTQLQTPLAHQLACVKAQIDVACRMQRSVSMHSVGAAGATVALLAEYAEYAAFRSIGRSCL